MLPLPTTVTPVGWYHLAFFGVLIPFGAIRTWRKLIAQKQPLPDRLKRYQRGVAQLIVFASISVLVALLQWIDLFPRPVFTWTTAAAGAAMFVVMVAAMRPRWRRAVERRTRVVYLYMPGNATERAWWVAVAVLAGIGEEITWRGVQTTLLATLTGSYLAGSLISAAMFGVAHAIQGWRTILIVFVLALGFQGLVWLSGSLYVAMVVHLTYDITAGLTYGCLGRQLGYRLEDAT